MKTLLLGYRVGIGKAIYENLNVEGVGKETIDIDKIEESNFDFSPYDCVIINSYSEFTSQLKTLLYIAENVSKDTLIIVIGSTSAYKTNPNDMDRLKYRLEKASIIRAGRDLISMGYNVSVISPDTTDTHYNIDKTGPKLKPSDIADKISYIIENYKNGILIDHLILRATDKK